MTKKQKRAQDNDLMDDIIDKIVHGISLKRLRKMGKFEVKERLGSIKANIRRHALRVMFH